MPSGAGRVPQLDRRIIRISPDRSGEHRESPIGNPAVDMHVRSRVEMRVGARLRAEAMLVSRVHHVAQAGVSLGSGIGPHDPGANQPALVLAGWCLHDPLIEGGAEAITD